MKTSQGEVCVCREALCLGTAHTGRRCLRWPLPCLGPCSPSTLWRLTAHCRLLPLRFPARLVCPREQSAKAGGITISSLRLYFSVSLALPHVGGACYACLPDGNIGLIAHVSHISPLQAGRVLSVYSTNNFTQSPPFIKIHFMIRRRSGTDW